MTIKRSIAKSVSFILPILAALVLVPRANAQSLTMDGESGIFLQPLADVVPSPQHKFGGPTVSFHAVDAGPVAGNYINIRSGRGIWELAGIRVHPQQPHGRRRSYDQSPFQLQRDEYL